MSWWGHGEDNVDARAAAFVVAAAIVRFLNSK
jgi:hypothetical protein